MKKLSKQFLEQQQKVKQGQFKRGASKPDKKQVSIRIREANYEWLKQYAKDNKLLVGDALDQLLESLK